MKKLVVGFLGTTLDRRGWETRWDHWRPSVAVCQHEDLLVDTFHLIYQDGSRDLADQVKCDIKTVSPETNVVLDKIAFKNPWDFEEVFTALLNYSQSIEFNRDEEELLLHITTGTHVSQICMFLLTEAGFFPGKLLQTGPGRRNAPPGSYEIIDLDLSRYDCIASRFRQQTDDDISFLKSGISTRNNDYNQLISEIEKVTVRSNEPILLMGPTGAGKSRLAKQIYSLKKQRKIVTGKFVEINCATLRGDMAMSVLFGHKKGAFTGATDDRAGLLKAAHKGILFLDEIGELGLDEQAMLLQAIEEKRYMPVGSDHEVESEFQLLSGTNRNLKTEVRKGKFREDLFARIKFWSFDLPGLSERREDIEPNINFELQRRSAELGKPITFSSEAKKMYLGFATGKNALWPANFRDLNNSISRMASLADGNRISADDVKREILRLNTEWSETTDSNTEKNAPLITNFIGATKEGELDLFDRIQLNEVLRICLSSSNIAEAGRKLFSESRKNSLKPNDSDRLRKYLQRFNISWEMLYNS
ncbi:MAG: sigma 54-interacting transcriptional regulator [Candidatus Riflebacteria bacterium]|nr:sigma 54-interacting transcriptional regulator [Candidatus Riflebacteria bacterium]